MSYLRKFDTGDILLNNMIANPQYQVTWYSGSAYINNRRYAGVNTPTGTINLFEINAGRDGNNIPKIYPFQVKDGTNKSFQSISEKTYKTSSYGTKLRGKYPLTASVDREYIRAGTLAETYDVDGNPSDGGLSQETYFSRRKRVIALKNTLDFYKPLSNSYQYSGSLVSGALSLVSIPSIMYGSNIEKGSVSLKVYFTGSLIDEAKDHRKNGELVSTKGNTSGSVVGIVLYNEGFMILNNTTTVNNYAYDDYRGTRTLEPFNWTYFGAFSSGSIKSETIQSPTGSFVSSSLYTIDFKGQTETPVITMFAHAPPGEVNNSQNLTWVSASTVHWKDKVIYNSSSYAEDTETSIKNTIKSQYCDHEADFEKQVFINEIGIYDKDKNLLGVAKLANPVLKKETDTFTFKLRMDL
jgi:hypothetical protein